MERMDEFIDFLLSLRTFNRDEISRFLSTSFFLIDVKTEDLNIPFDQLKAWLPDLSMPIRFHAGQLHCIQDEKGVTYAHTIQRNFKGSFGGSSENPGGKHEPGKDFTLLHTALREEREELGRSSVAYADRGVVSCFVHTSSETKETFLLVSVTFIVVDDHGLLPTHEFSLSEEHISQSWKTRPEIENAQCHADCPSPQDQFNMLPSKKACFGLGFEIWNDYQKSTDKQVFCFQSDEQCFRAYKC